VKQHPWDSNDERTLRSQNKKARRKTVAAILKEAYLRHVRDGLTRRAVKAVLH
jgi:hypothetical protein